MTGAIRTGRYWATALLAASLLGAGGCDALGLTKPTARVVEVHVQDVSMTSATLLFDVEISNPYSAALPLANVDYALSSGGAEFLSGEANLQGSVPAGNSKVLPVPVRIDFLQLVRVLEGVRPGSTIPYDAELGLSVDAPLAGRIRLPMAKSGELNIPDMPSFLPPRRP